MSPEDIDKLTLGELKAIAEAADKSLSLLQRVQGLLGGQQLAAPAPETPKTALKPAPQPNLSPEQRKALDDWKNNPERERLQAQFEKQNGDDLPAEMSAAERREQAKIFGKEFGQ